MRNRAVPLLLAAVMLMLSACGRAAPDPSPTATPAPTETPAPEVRQEFTLPRTEETMHPIVGRDKTNLSLSGLIWEGLFALNQAFLPQNVLCEGYASSEDGLVWTFTLKDGVTFSDGSPLTAGEVVDSLNLARSAGSRFAARLADVKSVAAAEGAVVVTLARPNGALPALLDIPIVKGEGDAPLGTGPYVLEGEDQRLTARTAWWNAKVAVPPAQTIPLRVLREADDLIYAFDTGDLSLVTADLTGSNALGFAGDGHEVWDYPTTTMVFVGYNCARGPCAAPALRRALSRGFDRNTVAVALYARHAQAAALPIHPDAAGYSQSAADLLAYSPQAMADALTAAGWEKNEEGLLVKNRRALELTFAVNTDNSFRLTVAEYLAAELGKGGITVDLQKLNWTEYQKALETGNFDLYLGSTAMTADFDPAPLVEAGGALNFGRYSDADTAALLAAYRAAAGAERETAAGALYQKLAGDAPFTALCFKNQSVLTQWGAVSGLSPTQQNSFYGIEEWNIRG